MILEDGELQPVINFEKVIERESELRYFPGWIPSNLLLYIQTGTYDGVKGRDDFLKEKGLYDNLYKKDVDYRKQLKSYETFEERKDFEVESVLQWVEKNPKFKDLISYIAYDNKDDIVFDDSDMQIPTPKL